MQYSINLIQSWNRITRIALGKVSSMTGADLNPFGQTAPKLIPETKGKFYPKYVHNVNGLESPFERRQT